ncbi:hypothetical protein [Mesorhizobium sp.]|uniref:hypothetical protein n=1 Tax=Mesorhizobium sp. TaxID=1871066 RepID=UPI0025D59D77|nr:hypothetical protein [Mesorhizobium sp.]
MAAPIGTVPAMMIGGIGAVAVWAYLFPALRQARHLYSGNWALDISRWRRRAGRSARAGDG